MSAVLFVERVAADETSVEASPDFSEQILPILHKHCAACHFGEEGEAGLGLDTYDALMGGGANGPVITPGHSDQSRLVRVLTGASEPSMPPEENEPLSAEEIALLRSWIDSGAPGPEGAVPDPTILVTPQVAVQGTVRDPITAVAISPRGDVVAVARYGEVQLESFPERQVLRRLDGHRGSVNAVSFSRDGQWLVAAAGEAGVFGEARLWEVETGQLHQVVVGHNDSLYAAELSPENALLATAGYDQKIMLWDTATGQLKQTLEGHNGPVFDLAFHPAGNLLASASGDRTVKLWDVASGERLDTLSQSLQELYTVAFSPDGQQLAAAGVDNRIRLWRISGSAEEGSNPLLDSRFAHEAAVLKLAYAPDGRTLVSTGEDRLVKVWDVASVRLQKTFPAQPDWTSGVAIAPDNRTVFVGRLDGTVGIYTLPTWESQQTETVERLDEQPPVIVYEHASQELQAVSEEEPNDAPDQAVAVTTLPARATGKIHSSDASSGERAASPGDMDLYRFYAAQGEQWVVETRAAQAGSPLDSKISILHADGRPVERLLLRAVRDSELEFRGMDSEQRGARLKYWEEMLLNQYAYIDGEVIKLYQQRRGPDSDAQFYPEDGKRFSYFGTSPRAHALGRPAYMVTPYPLTAELPDNGLPIFTLYWENDDDGERRLGSDSQLTFVAPEDGHYLIRVSDVRGFGGADYKYDLIIRRPEPDYSVTVSKVEKVNAGSGKSFTVKAERKDNFNGPIEVTISGLPEGLQATNPIVIEAGHLQAKGVLNALPGAAEGERDWSQLSIHASAVIGEGTVEKRVEGLAPVKVEGKPKLIVHLLPLEASLPTDEQRSVFVAPPEIVLRPGKRTPCQLIVERHGFEDRIQFEIENLPHGVIVDDIGLNGVLIPEGQTQRTIFLTAEPWVSEATRPFHAVAQAEGNQASQPMILHVRR